MDPFSFFHSQLIKLATQEGASLPVAKQVADEYLDRYKRSSHEGKPADLLLKGVKEAVKASKKEAS